jgi:hypothetical protein
MIFVYNIGFKLRGMQGSHYDAQLDSSSTSGNHRPFPAVGLLGSREAIAIGIDSADSQRDI